MGSRARRALTLWGLLAIVVFAQHRGWDRPRPGVSLADPVDLVLIGVVVVLELAAYYLSKPKNQSVARDDKPTTLSARGSYVPLVIGRRQVGAIIGAIGARATKKESVGGGKGGLFGGASSKETVYYEQGWHQLCVGPGAKLHRITQSGKAIFEGPITPVSHPSGTTVDLGREGSFRVYWGEGDQPIDSLLTTITGVASRWPFVMGIVWVSKRLGTTAQWPILNYEIETRPFDTQLVGSSPWMEASRTLTGSPSAAYSVTIGLTHYPAVVNGGPGTARFRGQGHGAYLYKPGTYVKLVNTGAGTKTMRVHHAVDTWVKTTPVNLDPCTDVYLDQSLVGATDDGTIQRYMTEQDDGVNPAHALDQLMFQEFPHGRGQDRSLYDQSSLEELGILLRDEGAPCSILAQDGENVDALVAALMQDFGFLIAPDPTTGLLRFKAIRAATTTPPNLTLDVLPDPAPEHQVLRDHLPTDRLQYVFSSRDRNFKDDSIDSDDDSQADLVGAPKARKLTIPTVIDRAAATKVSERRSQETLTNADKYRIPACRGARRMFPGQLFTTDDFDFDLRVVGIKRDDSTGKVELTAARDYYGTDVSTYSGATDANNEPTVADPVEDLAFTLVELPAYLVTGKQVVIVVPRIRASAQTTRADIYLSSDDVTYVQVGTELDYQTGGTLIDAVAATDAWELSQGPTFTVLGPDIDTVQDYTGDDSSWRLGRQVAVIDGEIFFLKKVTALGGSTYRLDGLIRARYDTVRQAHAVGATVFIFSVDSILQITDPLLVPDADLFVKTQPSTGESISLDSVTALEVTLRGKGVTPMDVVGLRTHDSSGSYRTGDDVVHDWGYQSALTPGTGAGMQPAGGPTGAAAVDGTFTLKIYGASGVSVLRTVTGLTTTTYTYTAANRTTDGLEGGNYWIGVVNVNSGYSSTELKVKVTHVT